MLPAPSIADLADFTGRPVATFGAFATSALAQATLMFSIVTKLKAYPEDPDLEQLAVYAIVEMADRLLLEQPYTSIKAGPFQTETIGSYSYSKSTTTTRTVEQGLKTGLFWWDVAVDELSVPGSAISNHGSIFVEWEGLQLQDDGTYTLVGPADGENDPPYIRIS